jgi:hypothetical protein
MHGVVQPEGASLQEVMVKAVSRRVPVRHTAIACVLGGAVTLGAGCGSDSDADDRPAAAPRVAQVAEAVCKLFFHCCARGELNYVFGPYVTRDNCAERIVTWSSHSPGEALSLQHVVGYPLELTFHNLAALERATAERRGRIDQEAVDDCVAYLDELECNQPVEADDDACRAPEPPPEPTPCDPDRLFVGQVKEGRACSSPGSSVECEEGLVCRADSEYGVFGECVAASQEDDLCFLDFECAEGLYCSRLYGTCRPFSQEGEPCAYADRHSIPPHPRTLLVRCAEHLFCDYVTDLCVAGCERGAPCQEDPEDSDALDPDALRCDQEQGLVCIAGRCDSPRAEGLPCAEDADCVEGLRCSPDRNDSTRTELVCQARLELSRPCSRHAECLSGFCHPDAHWCAPGALPGAACLTGEDAECDAGICIREDPNQPCSSAADCHCEALRADEERCSQDRQCFSEACVAGRCRQLPVPDGGLCDEAADCRSGYCNLALAEPACAELPLPLWTPCDPQTAGDCESGVCFDVDEVGEPVCADGLEEGEECDPGDATLRPCDPRRFYCDVWEHHPPVCVPWLESGDLCDSAVACRSGLCEPAGEVDSIQARVGRSLCVPAIPEGTAFCDGED